MRVTNAVDLGPEPESHQRFKAKMKQKAAEESAKLSPEEWEARSKNAMETARKALSSPSTKVAS